MRISQQPEDSMKKIRILLADDHAVVREGTRRVVEQEPDFEVVAEAGDGEEAVRLATECSPDVALIDIVMPKLNGIEATRQIKKICPDVAVLILSAYDDDQFIFGLLEAGAAGYLLKSVHSRQLIATIRAVWEGESVLHPLIIRRVLGRFASGQGKSQSQEFPAELTEREIEVLKLATKGLSNEDIAKGLGLSIRTVQSHFTRIAKKLHVRSRTEIVLRGLKEGWLNLSDIPASG